MEEFTTTTGVSSEVVRVVPDDEHYIVNWHMDGLDPTKTYRIRVLARLTEEFQRREISLEEELGHVDVKVFSGGGGAKNAITGDEIALKDGRTLPIKFRIEEGYFPVGELAPTEREKVSAILLEQFYSGDVAEPVEAVINYHDNQIPLPDLPGVEILKRWELLGAAFVRISNPETVAALAQSDNIRHVYENGSFVPLSDSWQVFIGQPVAESWGYTGSGTAVALLDDGGAGPNPLPEGWLVDLTRPWFGGCDDVGTPESCRVVATHDFWPEDGPRTHMNSVAEFLAKTAPGTDIVALDVAAQADFPSEIVNDGLEWVLANHGEYNIKAINMSFASVLQYTDEDCTDSYDHYFEKLEAVGIKSIAGSGKWGGDQENTGDFARMSSPACSPYTVSVGCGDTSVWRKCNRTPFLDLVAPNTEASYATGMVSGAWVILRAAFPDFGLDEILQRLKDTGVPAHDPPSGLTIPSIQIHSALSGSCIAEISGTVTLDEDPVAGASISVTRTGGPTVGAVTGNDGSYLVHLPSESDASTWTVTAQFGSGSQTTSVTLLPCERRVLDFGFTSPVPVATAITGTVTVEGVGMSGLQVVATGQGGSFTDDTDATGAYLINGLSEGDWEVSVPALGLSRTVAVPAGETVVVDFSVGP
jgi:hypothetical protein